MFETRGSTFLKQSVLLIVLLSCSERPAPLPSINNESKTAGSIEQGSSSTSQSGASSAAAQTGRESGETAVEPTVITGAFLACDFQPPPAPGATTAKLGCRMADNTTGAKHDMSQYPDFTWGYEPLDTGITATVTVATSPDDPWHAYYDITSRLGTLDAVSDMLKVGLTLKDGSATYYQTVGSVTGRLGLLLNGTWVESCSQPFGSGFYYTKMKSVISNGNTVVATVNYSTDATCASSQFTAESTTSLIKLIYNGAGFIADVQHLSWKITPTDATGLTSMQQRCPGLNFQLNVATEAISCTKPPDSRIEYTNIKLENKLQQQSMTWAEGSGANTGKSPELRMTDFSQSPGSIKQ
jgi:hypothetical protein